MATRRQISIFINGKEVANQIKPLTAEKQKIVRELRNMTIGSEAYNKKMRDLDKIKPIINKHNQDLRGVGSSYDKLKAGAGKFLAVAGIAFTAEAIVSYGKELFKAGIEMDTLERKANTVLGPALEFVSKKAEENANAMGLTANEYIAATTAIADILIPMGFQRDKAAEVSTSLVDLSGALSEWTGGQKTAQEVTEILGKALTGEREQLKTLGIVIQEADVNAKLAQKGLKGLTGEMLQQAKAAATLELITEKSIDAQTSFAENSESLIRRQAELQAKVSEVSETLALALIPVFEDLLEIASAGADILKSFTEAMTELSDPVKAATGEFDRQQDKVNELEASLNPLLSRYDELSTKSNLSKEEQEELRKVIQKIGEITPTAIKEIDEYGNILSINADKSKAFLEAEKARLAFINKESIKSIEERLQFLNNARAAYIKTIENDADDTFLGINIYDITAMREEVAAFTKEITGANAELARLKGEPIVPTGPAPENTNKNTSPTEEEILAAAAAAERLRKEREKAAEKEIKALEKKFEKLRESTQKANQEAAFDQLTTDEQALEKIRQKYDEQIALAKELEAKGFTEATELRLQLEALRFEQVETLRAEQAQAATDADLAREEAKQEEENLRYLEELGKKEEAKALIAETLRTEQEQELIELQLHYLELTSLAEQYGLDTAAITQKYEDEKAAIEKKAADKSTKELIETQKKKAQVLSEAFNALAGLATEALAFIDEESTKSVNLQKVITLAQLGFKSAEAIANATAASAGVPFPGNIAAIATAVGSVLSNLAQARKLFKDTPSVPQRKDGGYHNITGADDGRMYRAQYIGSPQTGMLPNGPVLTASGVLANERGREYFVANHDLANPAVANYVGMIENIRKNRFTQRAEGGFNETTTVTTPAPAAAPSNEATAALARELNRLNSNIEKGITAVIDDDEVINVFRKFNQLNEASGGTLS